jgi:hypothetical protein
MKMTFFWDDAPPSLLEIYRRFGGTYCLHHQGDDNLIGKIHMCRGLQPQGTPHARILLHPDDGGRKHLRNVGQFVPDYRGATSQRTAIFSIVLFLLL